MIAVVLKWFHVPVWVDVFFPRRVWRRPVNSSEKIIYLTFDDGPTANLTDWILNELEKYEAKATFFCVGGNMQKFPEKLKEIESLGHKIGNHTFSHLNGFKTTTNAYIEDVKNASGFHPSKLFRPPYGKLKSSQAKILLQQGYEIIMWSVLTYDFDKNLDTQKAWKQIVKHAKSGSVIVFHDNEKARKNLQILLPKFLEYFSTQGFTFHTL